MSETELVDHWEATADNWRAGCSRLHWIATFADDAGLLSVARTFRTRLDGLPLRRIDEPWLHMTIHDVAIDGELGESTLHRLVADAEASCAAELPLEIELGAPAAHRTAVILPAADPGALDSIRRVLRASDVKQRGADARPLPIGGAAHPHVSLAYAEDDVDADVLDHALAVAARPVRAVVSRLAIVRMNRDYTWDEIARVPARP